MYRFATLAVLAAAVVSAQAFEYRVDSGDSQTGAGLSTGGNFAWMQQFTVSGENSLITAIQLAFGTDQAGGTGFSGVSAGSAFTVYVWKGTPTGSGSDAPTLLASQVGSVAAGSIDTDIFQTVSIDASITGTSNFFIGASVNHAANTNPASLQTTGTGPWPIAGAAWVAGSSTSNGFDPNNLGGGIGLFTAADAGIPGNFLLRAQAAPVPEPATMVALAGAIGALAARRRKKA